MSTSAVPAKSRSYHGMLHGRRVVIYIVCTLLAILSILPFWVMFVNATRSTNEIQSTFSLIPSKYLLSNWELLMSRNFSVWGGMLNSLFIAVSSTVLCVYFSSLTAYGLVVYDFRLKHAAFAFIVGVLMIPTQVSAVGFFRLMVQLGINNTFTPLIVPSIAAPTVVFFMRQYMLSAFPLDLVDAARIDGSGEFYTFNRIALPIMKPAIATQAIFAFIASWNNFFTPSMILSDSKKYTLPMLVQLLKGDRYRTEYGTIYLGLALTTIPLFIVYFILSKHIIRGVALGGVKE